MWYRVIEVHACAEGISQKEAAAHFNISRDSVAKMMEFSVPLGYRRTAPVKRPKLDGLTGNIDDWLEGDLSVHRKQQHTAKRVFKRLRDEHDFTGGYTKAKDHIREHQRRGREMFVSLAHPALAPLKRLRNSSINGEPRRPYGKQFICLKLSDDEQHIGATPTAVWAWFLYFVQDADVDRPLVDGPRRYRASARTGPRNDWKG